MNIEQARRMLDQIKANPHVVNQYEAESAIDGLFDSLPFAEVQRLVAEMGLGHVNTPQAARRELIDAVRAREEAGGVELEDPRADEPPSLEEQFVDRWIRVQDMVRAGHLAKSDEMEQRIARIRNADDAGDMAGGIKEMDAILTGPKAPAAVPESERPQLVPKAEPKPETPLKVDTSAAEKRLDAKFDAFEAELAKFERSLGIGPEEPMPTANEPPVTTNDEPIAPAAAKASPSAPLPVEHHAYQFADPEERAVENPFELPEPAADVFELPEDQSPKTEPPTPPASQQAAPASEPPMPPLSPERRGQVQEPQRLDPAQQPKASEPPPSLPATQQAAPSQPVMTEQATKVLPQPQEPQTTAATHATPSQSVMTENPETEKTESSTAADISIPKGPEAAKAAEPDPIPSFAPKAGETWDEQTERLRAMRKAIQEGRGGELTEPIAPAGSQAAPTAGPQDDLVKNLRSELFGASDKLLAELAEKSGISPERHEEIKSRAAARAEDKAAERKQEEQRGLDPIMPGFWDVIGGGAKLDFASGDLEWKGGSKAARGWDDAQDDIERRRSSRGRSAAPSAPSLGDSEEPRNFSSSPAVTANDVREAIGLLREILAAVKNPKPSQQSGQANQNGFASALPPRQPIAPSSVPTFKGPAK
jgi:hypothetical protein